MYQSLAGTLIFCLFLICGRYAGAADIAYTLDSNLMPAITIGGKALVNYSIIGFNKNFSWVSTKHEAIAPDTFRFSSDAQGISAIGKWSFEREKMTCKLQLTASKDIPDAIGAGYEFRPAWKDPVLGGKDAEPELLPDNTGWSWEIEPGRKIRFVWSPGMASVFFERGQKGAIRVYYYTAVKAGQQDITFTVELPKGAEKVRSLAERYGSADSSGWYANPLSLTESFVDLSFLNHTPAGKFGFVQAKDDKFTFENGQEIRFWGCNVQAYSLFITDKEMIKAQAKRIAKLGFNLVRLHHHDSLRWVNPSLIKHDGETSQVINPAALDSYFYWIKCLKDEGVYLWVDLHTGRLFKEGDNIPGYAEVFAREKKKSPLGTEMKGYCYVNERVEALLKKFNEELLTAVNPYTKLALKDEPAVMGILLTNENDLTGHFGNALLPDKNVPEHCKLMTALADRFASEHALSADKVKRYWEPGDSKLFLNDAERNWDQRMIEHLRGLGVRAPICSGHIWGGNPLSSLPALTSGNMIDVHNYEAGEFLDNNPRYKDDFFTTVVRSHVAGMPLTITEYNGNDHAEIEDVFTIPLYISAMSAFQGLSAPMLFAYSQDKFKDLGVGGYLNNAYKYPGVIGLYPAAALLFRRDVAAAKETIYAALTPDTLFRQANGNTCAFSTLQGLHRVLVALPQTPELSWLKKTDIPAGAKSFTDLQQDFISPGRQVVESDTGELSRDWKKGIFTINTPASQGVTGWLKEAGPIPLGTLTITCSTPKATIIVSSLDGKPLAKAERILISAVARTATRNKELFCEPVAAEILLKHQGKKLLIAPLAGDGTPKKGSALSEQAGTYKITISGGEGTPWFLLTAE